jgi:hypothetical protein
MSHLVRCSRQRRERATIDLVPAEANCLRDGVVVIADIGALHPYASLCRLIQELSGQLARRDRTGKIPPVVLLEYLIDPPPRTEDEG